MTDQQRITYLRYALRVFGAIMVFALGSVAQQAAVADAASQPEIAGILERAFV